MTTWTNATTYAILLALLLACIGYAYGIVRRIRNREREHGQTAWLVVIGCAAVLLAIAGIVAANYGLDLAIEIAVIGMIAFAVGGLPMIAEYVDDHLQQRQQQRIKDRLAHLLEQED